MGNGARRAQAAYGTRALSNTVPLAPRKQGLLDAARHFIILRGSGGGSRREARLGHIVELIDLRPHIFQPPMYGRLIYTVMYMSERLLIQANPNPHLPTPQNSVVSNHLRQDTRVG